MRSGPPGGYAKDNYAIEELNFGYANVSSPSTSRSSGGRGGSALSRATSHNASGYGSRGGSITRRPRITEADRQRMEQERLDRENMDKSPYSKGTVDLGSGETYGVGKATLNFGQIAGKAWKSSDAYSSVSSTISRGNTTGESARRAKMLADFGQKRRPLYRNQGKLKEADEMYQRALKGNEKALGLEHTSTLDTVNNLDLLYREEADRVHQAAMREREGRRQAEDIAPHLAAEVQEAEARVRQAEYELARERELAERERVVRERQRQAEREGRARAEALAQRFPPVQIVQRDLPNTDGSRAAQVLRQAQERRRREDELLFGEENARHHHLPRRQRSITIFVEDDGRRRHRQ